MLCDRQRKEKQQGSSHIQRYMQLLWRRARYLELASSLQAVQAVQTDDCFLRRPSWYVLPAKMLVNPNIALPERASAQTPSPGRSGRCINMCIRCFIFGAGVYKYTEREVDR